MMIHAQTKTILLQRLWSWVKPSTLILMGILVLSSCGGGGGSESSSDNNTSTNANNNGGNNTAPPPNTTSMQTELASGKFWTYFWNTSTRTFAQPNTTTNSSGHGEFTITLGGAVTINGQDAFPLNISGDTGVFAPRWTHVAISGNGSLLGSTDGINLVTIYNAETDNWVGGGFFVGFGDSEAVELSAGTFRGEYNTINALVAVHSASDGGCETILGVTLCSETSTDFSENEYYKEGIGPIGYEMNSSYSSNGGGFFTSTQVNQTIELVATSFVPVDGSTFNPPPWVEVAPLNTARSDYAAVVVSGEIYVIGGFNGALLTSVEIYNPATNEWRAGPSLPTTGGRTAEVIAGTIYTPSSTAGNIHAFNPATDTVWRTITPAPAAAGSFGYDTATYNDATFGDIIVGVAGASVVSRTVEIHALQPSGNQWLSGTSLTVTELLRPSIAIIGDLVYVIGGFGEVGSADRGALASMFTYDLLFDNWRTVGPASMATARDNSSAVVLDGRIVVLGGNAVSCGFVDCNVGETYRSAESFDPASNTWSEFPSMFAARKDFDAVALDGKIYAIGGNSGGGVYLSDVERYTP